MASAAQLKKCYKPSSTYSTLMLLDEFLFFIIICVVFQEPSRGFIFTTIPLILQIKDLIIYPSLRRQMKRHQNRLITNFALINLNLILTPHHHLLLTPPLHLIILLLTILHPNFIIQPIFLVFNVYVIGAIPNLSFNLNEICFFNLSPK
jgi:hypothetical protein